MATHVPHRGPKGASCVDLHPPERVEIRSIVDMVMAPPDHHSGADCRVPVAPRPTTSSHSLLQRRVGLMNR